MSILLSTAYLPPVEYLSLLLKEDVEIEKCENFVKQTYRNRALIPTANGILPLTIPVKKHGLHNCPITKVEIDYSQSWQRMHWRAIEAAYNASPFFLYYKDYFYPFYHQQDIKYLFDFNIQLLTILLKLFKIDKKIHFTSTYAVLDKNEDLRLIIHPKKRECADYPFNNMNVYRQVFLEKTGFIPNLSCIDLLFNEGNWAIEKL